jgi:hypothetical protein
MCFLFERPLYFLTYPRKCVNELPKAVVLWLALMLHIREDPDSNILRFVAFLSPSMQTPGLASHDGSQQLSSTSFGIYFNYKLQCYRF